MDALSGLLLMSFPLMALQWMRVPSPPEEAVVFVQFVGAFVFAIGMTYLFAWLDQQIRRRLVFTRHMLVMTGWVRLVICAFTLKAILQGGLSVSWLSVPVTDGLLAVLQFGILSAGWLAHED